MKKNLETSFVILLAIACFTFIGCTALDKAVLSVHQTITPAITNAVAVVTTNADGGKLTNIAEVVTPAKTNSEFIPAPAASTGIKILGGLPIPWAGTAGAVLTAALSMYASGRNKKLAAALVTGIEAGRRILQTTPEGQALDVQVKAALVRHQSFAGVLSEAGKLVESLTGQTTAPAL